MSNYYNNGLYDEPFFTEKKIYFHVKDSIVSSGIKYNYSLLKTYYLEIGNTECQDIKTNEKYVDELFWYDITYNNTYFKPLIFDEIIALKCHLVPFFCKEYELLAIGELWLSILPRLDAYQVLTHKTIDHKSILFTDFEHFERVVGKELTKEILKILS